MTDRYPVGIGTMMYTVYDTLSKTDTLSLALAQELQASISPFENMEGLNEKENNCIEKALATLQEVIMGENIPATTYKDIHDRLLKEFHSLLY